MRFEDSKTRTSRRHKVAQNFTDFFFFFNKMYSITNMKLVY